MDGDLDTLPEALEHAAERFGDTLAYAEGTRRLTWSDLAARVGSVAAGLTGLGLARGDRVAICAENSVDWVTAYHAIVRAGCIPVLIYYELQPGEIATQVSWPGCWVLFASSSVIEKLEGEIEGLEHIVVMGSAHGAATGVSRPSPLRPGSGEPGSGRTDGGATRSPTPVTSLEALIEGASEDLRAGLESRAPQPGDIAVIVYTSGTTGGAKGVMLSHRNLVSNATAAIEALDLSAEDSSLLVLPLHHALPFLAAVVLPPLIGAHFVIENDLRRIRDRLQEYKPTIFFGVPALYELIYRNVLARAEAEGRLKTLRRVQAVTGLIKRVTGVNLAPIAFRSVSRALGGRLKFMISGGAALNPQTVHDFSSLGLLLLQGWGMTEASPVIAVQRYDRHRFRYSNYYEKHAGSVGPALPGVEVRLVDVPEKDITVAAAGEGEVQVHGENVFLGYWQAEDATSAALRDGWLSTGDLGRVDGEGNIYLTGRSKYVIVLESGEKVHPDEIEALLAQSDLLQDLVILGRTVAEPRGPRTYVTALVYPGVEAAQARASSLDADRVRSLVQGEIDGLCKQLAAYKRVTRIELSDRPLPKTALRKVARGALRERYEFEYDVWVTSGEGGG